MRAIQRLLISVKGPNETRAAVKGGAHIIDAEYPFSALGSAYPLNIHAIRNVTPMDRLVSTNIGEKQYRWSTSGQAALGVALAGADIIKVGLGAINDKKKAITVMNNVTRNVKYWFPTKITIATLFADHDLADCVEPNFGPEIAKLAKADGLLIDTYNKYIGKNLLDYLSYSQLTRLAKECHSDGLELWVAGSINKTHLPKLWEANVDVVCSRGAACIGSKNERGGAISTKLVSKLVKTIPRNKQP